MVFLTFLFLLQKLGLFIHLYDKLLCEGAGRFSGYKAHKSIRIALTLLDVFTLRIWSRISQLGLPSGTNCDKGFAWGFLC